MLFFGQMALGCIQERAGREPGRVPPWWSLLQFLPPGSCVEHLIFLRFSSRMDPQLEMSAEITRSSTHSPSLLLVRMFYRSDRKQRAGLSVTGQTEDFNYLISIGMWVSCLSLNTNERQATKPLFSSVNQLGRPTARVC